MTGFKILSRTKKRKFPHQPVGQVPLLLLFLDLPLENHFLKDFYLTLKGRWYPDRKFISSSNSLGLFCHLWGLQSTLDFWCLGRLWFAEVVLFLYRSWTILWEISALITLMTYFIRSPCQWLSAQMFLCRTVICFVIISSITCFPEAHHEEKKE